MSNLPVINMDIKRLPSQGKVYPKDFVIQYRSYSFGEIQKVATSKLNERQVIELILSGVKTNLSKKLFTLNDVLFIGLLRKISSLGTAKVRVPFTNPVTKKVDYHLLSIDDIEFYDIQAPAIPATVTMSDGNDYEFGPMLVKDYLNLVKAGKDKDPVAMYSAMCRNHPFNEVYSFFNNTQSREDGEILEEIDELFSHGIKPIEVKYTFEKGGQKVEKTLKIRLEERQALLLPFREEGKSVRDKIRFGTTS